MGNLSQEKRKVMKAFLEKMKDEHIDDDEVLIALGEIENELDSKKYGLVWENHEEAVDIKMQTHIPVFSEWSEKEIVAKDEERCNFLLEGDNLHSLHLLNKTHRGKIDVIYIDPPYNTENSLTYDDKRVGAEDSFRHSKWLSFMSERLSIARELLKQDGIMFVSIDDNEAYQLKILLDEVFDEENCMGVFSVIKAEGGGMAKYIVKGHDLLFVYARNLSKAHPLAREKDVRGRRITIDNVEYWIQEDAIRENFGQYGNLYYEDVLEKRGEEYKKQIDEKIKNNEYMLVPKEEGKTIIGKLRRLDEDYSKFYSVIKHLNADGVNTLKGMGLADDFDYPKPVSLIKDMIKAATFFSNKPITVLDFFAGSGTTAQAVLELNKEDGKDRNFILCTNNEVSARGKLKFVNHFGILEGYTPTAQTTDSAIEKKIFSAFDGGEKDFNKLVADNKELYESFGICQAVTYQRIKKVIDGYTSQNEESKVLYEKKITEKNYYKAGGFKEEIEKIKAKGEYEEYKEKITNDSKLQLIVKSEKGHVFEPTPSNLKYYKTDFVSRDEEYLSEALIGHIKEMIQLEYGIRVDEKKYIMVLNDDQADDLAANLSQYPDIKAIYVSNNVLFTTEQNRLFKEIDKYIIPDYYFDFELKEVGEIW